MSDRRKIQPFHPATISQACPPIVRHSSESGGTEWTAEDLATLARLTRAPEDCAGFLILGFSEGADPIPGYEGYRLHMGANIPADLAFELVHHWVEAERNAVTGQN